MLPLPALFTIANASTFNESGNIIRAGGCPQFVIGSGVEAAVVRELRTFDSIAAPSLRADTTAYVVGDVMYVGVVPWQCITAGTTAGTPPAGYTTSASMTRPDLMQIDDGTATFQAVGAICDYTRVQSGLLSKCCYIGTTPPVSTVGTTMGTITRQAFHGAQRIYIEGSDGNSGYFDSDGAGGVSYTLDDGTEVLRLDDDATAGNTRMLLYDVDAGALVRVSVGAADSGGVGFKALRVPN